MRKNSIIKSIIAEKIMSSRLYLVFFQAQVELDLSLEIG
jgi:hypothetical protein